MKMLVMTVLMASGMVQAGGDPITKVPCGSTKVVECKGPEVAVRCEPTKCKVCDTTPCVQAECPKCEPIIKYVDVPPVREVEYVQVAPLPVKGKWLLAASGGYLGDPAVGGGGGYRWANGVEVLAQGMYLDTNVERVSWAHTFGHGHCAQTYAGYKDVGQDGTWGGVVTVVVPIGNK